MRTAGFFCFPACLKVLVCKQVVMTRESCLEEVTQGKAVYVENPYDVEEWAEKIDKAMMLPSVPEMFEEYEPQNVVRRYVLVFERVYKA